MADAPLATEQLESDILEERGIIGEYIDMPPSPGPDDEDYEDGELNDHSHANNMQVD